MIVERLKRYLHILYGQISLEFLEIFLTCTIAVTTTTPYERFQNQMVNRECHKLPLLERLSMRSINIVDHNSNNSFYGSFDENRCHSLFYLVLY